MKTKSKKKKLHVRKGPAITEGYPVYPPSEDVYGNLKKEKKVDPDDRTKTKTPAPKPRKGKFNEKDFDEDFSGSDLDIPGSEEDELEVNMGSEDEENNFYSLGGDAHNELDEDEVE